MIHLWRGFHHPHLSRLLESTWEKNELLILVPMTLKDFSFARLLAASELEFHGEWSEEQKTRVTDQAEKRNPGISSAQLGVFTSGTSSGQSRLVFYTKKNVQSSLESIRELYETEKIKKIFCYPQPTHTFGLVLGYLQALLYKLEMISPQGAYTRDFHQDWIEKVDEGTLTLGAPTHFLDLIQYVQSYNLTPRASYSCIVGGARVGLDLWTKMQSVLRIDRPSVGYGATEAAPGVTHLPPGVKPSEDGDIGYALRGVDIQLKEEGLEFTGPNLCYALWENGELKKFQKILLRDSAVQVAGRYIYWGRTDSIINRGGIKISLEAVEGWASQHLSVKATAVRLYHERLGEDVGLLVQTESSLDKNLIQAGVQNSFGFLLKEENILFISQIPLNANGKPDRVEAVKALMKTKSWSFPWSVEHLKCFLPHRGSAIWVDSLLEVQPQMGKGQIVLKEKGHYFSLDTQGEAFIRPTACVEWVAQTYGYLVAASDIMGLQQAAQASKTYIAEVKKADFYIQPHQKNLKPGAVVTVEVRCTHDFGKLKVVEGQIFYKSDLLASVSTKLYCG